MTKIGLLVFGGSYALSVFIPVATGIACYVVPGLLGGGDSDSETSCTPDPANTLPYLIPLAGPFVALASEQVRADRGMVFWGMVSAAGQLGGAVTLAIGLASKPAGATANGRASWRIIPLPTDRGGLSLLGQF